MAAIAASQFPPESAACCICTFPPARFKLPCTAALISLGSDDAKFPAALTLPVNAPGCTGKFFTCSGDSSCVSCTFVASTKASQFPWLSAACCICTVPPARFKLPEATARISLGSEDAKLPAALTLPVNAPGCTGKFFTCSGVNRDVSCTLVAATKASQLPWESCACCICSLPPATCKRPCATT
ncbi:hypothetical protein MiSe_92810 [Microseira wollei NIES-4236]|uniref:Uncharacterized protein n=1 Tax=Microseira wollei NIES-4236 TaxID=2530354 RepID=A0AAV3XTT8_9CYAN|nr:hypothetical protein MiSe_92810 [Microseira wollei NIES-4236]